MERKFTNGLGAISPCGEPSPLGLRPEPLRVSAIRRVSTIAGQALAGAAFLYLIIFAFGAIA